METILTVSELRKVYPAGAGDLIALQNFNLSVRAGEFIGIQGPSGCGKSTLLNIIGLCEPPTAGNVILSDELVDFANEKKLAQLRRGVIGYVFQFFNLLQNLSAIENVLFTLALNGTSGVKARRCASELLERVGLHERMNHLPSQLSGGEMQRVALCRAIAPQPKLLIADEPTGNLDSHAGEEVLGLLDSYVQNGGCIVMASHSSEALTRCSRVVRLRDGGVV